MIEYFEVAMKWIVAPIGAGLWLIYKRQQEHHTTIAVMEAEITSLKVSLAAASAAHDRRLDQIINKLESIEVFLRK